MAQGYPASHDARFRRRTTRAHSASAHHIPAVGECVYSGPMAERRFDIVLFGATGFTGGLTAEYLARNVPAQARWALAGRNRAKLEAVRERLAAINPSCVDLELLTADVSQPETLKSVAESTRVVITT